MLVFHHFYVQIAPGRYFQTYRNANMQLAKKLLLTMQGFRQAVSP